MKKISDLRKDYSRSELDEDRAHNDPLAQFHAWFDEALEHETPEPSAMTVATVDERGRPSTRIVLAKDVDRRGIVWYTNYLSRKGRELAGNQYAALQFHWVEHERVVRIEGLVEKVSAEESDAYFASRPLASRIGAWASEQSQPISSRAVMANSPVINSMTSSAVTCARRIGIPRRQLSASCSVIGWSVRAAKPTTLMTAPSSSRMLAVTRSARNCAHCWRNCMLVPTLNSILIRCLSGKSSAMVLRTTSTSCPVEPMSRSLS